MSSVVRVGCRSPLGSRARLSSHGREWPRKLTETLQFHNRAGDRILGRTRAHDPGRWDGRGPHPAGLTVLRAVRPGLSAKPPGTQSLLASSRPTGWRSSKASSRPPPDGVPQTVRPRGTSSWQGSFGRSQRPPPATKPLPRGSLICARVPIETFLDALEELVAEVTVGVELLFPAAGHHGGIRRWPILDVGRDRPRKFQCLVMRLGS